MENPPKAAVCGSNLVLKARLRTARWCRRVTAALGRRDQPPPALPDWLESELPWNRSVFANTGIRLPSKPPRVTAFHRLSHAPVVSDFLFRVLNYPVKKMHMVQGDRSSIGPAERRAYRWPLRRIRDRAAPLALARLVPTSFDSPTLATLQEADGWARSFKGPVRLVWGRRDPILGRTIDPMKKLFPDAEVTETGAGHFLQEEVPEELATAILELAL